MSIDKDSLTSIECATIVALADACNDSLNAHPPIEAIYRKFPSHLHGNVKKTLNKLRTKGLCIKHPTGGSITYYISREGLEIARELRKRE